jgi:ribosomal protein S18 acetylase RimI-like enzyme
MPTHIPDIPVALRPARAEDEAFLHQVYGSTRAEELDQVDWSEDQKQAFVDAQFAAQRRSYLNNYPGAEFLVVMAAGEPAGRLYLHRRRAEIRIMDLALLPTYRGRGIGSHLLRQIMAEAQADGRQVTIHVEKFNPALRLYQRLGFRVLQDEGIYYFLAWERAPEPHAR